MTSPFVDSSFFFLLFLLLSRKTPPTSCSLPYPGFFPHPDVDFVRFGDFFSDFSPPILHDVRFHGMLPLNAGPFSSFPRGRAPPLQSLLCSCRQGFSQFCRRGDNPCRAKGRLPPFLELFPPGFFSSIKTGFWPAIFPGYPPPAP